jgi:hypothetical protein
VPDRSQASWPLGGAEVAGSGFVPSPLGVRGGGAVPDRSQASSPLGGAEVAGSGPVPSSLGQALCPARWVRLRAKPLRRTGRGRCARSLPGIVASGRR